MLGFLYIVADAYNIDRDLVCRCYIDDYVIIEHCNNGLEYVMNCVRIYASQTISDFAKVTGIQWGTFSTCVHIPRREAVSRLNKFFNMPVETITYLVSIKDGGLYKELMKYATSAYECYSKFL